MEWRLDLDPTVVGGEIGLRYPDRLPSHELGWDGMGWRRTGWDGMGWDGVGWGGAARLGLLALYLFGDDPSLSATSSARLEGSLRLVPLPRSEIERQSCSTKVKPAETNS